MKRKLLFCMASFFMVHLKASLEYPLPERRDYIIQIDGPVDTVIATDQQSFTIITSTGLKEHWIADDTRYITSVATHYNRMKVLSTIFITQRKKYYTI